LLLRLESTNVRPNDAFSRNAGTGVDCRDRLWRRVG
jgi:hypothetical protein